MVTRRETKSRQWMPSLRGQQYKASDSPSILYLMVARGQRKATHEEVQQWIGLVIRVKISSEEHLGIVCPKTHTLGETQTRHKYVEFYHEQHPTIAKQRPF